MTKQERRKYDNWRELASQCQESGVSVNRWCKLNHVPTTTCRQWLSKLKRQELNEKEENDIELKIWGKVDLEQSGRAQSLCSNQIPSLIRISYHEWNIEVKENFDPILLSQIIKVVDTIC
ncbi:MAG TPA: hypothetical protein VM577_13745 [Anaerovoracaceae bacterium]|nr:hypothetical protein [Anaerovoracaceae bacterium]